MAVEATIGIVSHRLRVDDRDVPVRRAGRGWYAIPGIGPGGSSRIRYSPFSDRIRIEAAGPALEIRFHLRRTTFVWQGRAYRIRSMAWGRVVVEREGRAVVRGTITWSGVRLDRVVPEIAPIVRELALGLAFRAAWLMSAAVAAGAH
ncbi:MAG TPA: hypothetical protein VJ326_03660 [Thermoplasmata archaeon]|nr:hypothetical protein [Thermoplasmata archaeon]